MKPRGVLKKIIYNDLKTTDTCNYLLLKDGFWSSSIYTPLRKNSPYTKAMSAGWVLIIKLQNNNCIFK